LRDAVRAYRIDGGPEGREEAIRRIQVLFGRILRRARDLPISFVSGWKMSPEHLENVQNRGSL
jgi:hypothetical protein